VPGGILDGVGEVYAVCSSVPEEAPLGLATGRHHGELRVAIAGAAVQPVPAMFEFDLSCGSSTASMAPPTAGQGGGGCSMATGAPPECSPAVLLIALALLAARPRE
jgi:hypothetical protein